MAKTYRDNAKRLGKYVYDTRTGKTSLMEGNAYNKASEQFLANARKKEKQESWFDVPDENLGTLGNLFVSGVEGLGQVGNAILGSFESADDFRRNRIADVQELFGHTAAAEKTRRQAEEEWSAPIIGKYGKELQEATEGLDEYSIFGGKADSVFQGVGSSILAQGLAVPGQITGGLLGFGTKGMEALGSVTSLGSMGVSAAGGNETQARIELRQQFPDMSTEEINKRARTYGAITGTGEVLSEMMFGGISKASNTLGIGKGVFDSFDDAVAQGLTKHIENKILKTLVQSGIKASGEGVEEIVSGLFEIAGKKLALMDDTDIMTMLQDEALLDSFLSGTLSAAITQAPGVVTNIQNTNNGIYRDYVSGLSENEQKVVDAVTESRIGEEEKTAKERNEIRNEVKEQLLNGRLSISEINKSLKEEIQGSPADVYLHNISRNESSQFDVLEEERNKVKTKNQENLLKEASELKSLNNAQEIHDIYSTLNAIQGVNDSIQYHLTTTEGLYEMGLLEKNSKGEYTLKGEKYIPRGITKDGNNIYVNADVGAKSGTQAMYHEMFEAFKSTSPEEYNQFKQMVRDIVGEDIIQSEIEEYRKMYNIKENSEGLTNDVEDEIINDKFGEIAESEEFLRRITENRTLLQKFMDKIKEFIKYLKGTQQEKSLIKLKQNLEKKFNELYKGTQFKSTKGNTVYSVDKDGKVKIDSKQNKNVNEKTLYDSLIGTTLQFQDGTTAKIIKNLKDIKMYKELLHRTPAYKNVSDIKETNKLINNNIVELFENSKFVGNKEDVNNRHSKYGVESFDTRDVTFEDDNGKSYKLGLSIAKLENGESIAYAKKYLEGLKDNKKTNPLDKSQSDSFHDNNISQNDSDVKYSLTDNQGRQLSEQQQEYFKDSKVRDDDGNLLTIYHTTTDDVAQFNEFNPVGTPYYRFGEQIVNYFTDSKEMSGSYANQKYEMADTNKTTSMEEVEKYLHDIAIKTNDKYNIKEANGKYQLVEEKRVSKEAKDFVNSLSENELQQMRDNIYVDEQMAGTPYERAFEWDKFDKPLQTKFNNALEMYMGTADLVDLQQEIMRFVENPNLMIFDPEMSGKVIGNYNTKEELFRKYKEDIGNSDWTENTKVQYEGYLNITNPYVVDAEQRNWNQVVQQSNEFIDALDERVPQSDKDRLINLFKESQEKSAEARENFSAVEGAANYGLQKWVSNNIDEDIKNVAHAMKFTNSAYGGADVFETYIENVIPSTSSFYHELADSLAINGVITSEEKNQIFDDWVIPDRVTKLIKENLDKPFKSSELGDNRILDFVGEETTLRELYNLLGKVYSDVDTYRYEDSYFIEQLENGNVDIGSELEDILQTRAEIMGTDSVAKEIAEASKNGFSKPQLIRTWGTSKTTNDVVLDIIKSNESGETNYDGVIIKNVVDYGGKAEGKAEANNVYVTFNSNQFKAVDNTNPTGDADIRYSLTKQTDSEDEKLTPQQYEYFKNTKAVDDLGELEVVHHGTTHDFNIFDIEKAGETGLQFGNGFYFTNSRGKALGFTEGGLYGDNYDQVKSGYVNIEKPASRDTKTMTFDEFKDLYNALNTDPNMWMEDMEMSGIDALLSDYGDIYNDKEGTIKTFYESYDNDVNLIDNLSYMYNPTEMYKVLRDVTGYDGIIIDNPSGYDAYEKYYVAFNPDQFKLKSNENPTNNVDMRLSLTKAENQKYNGVAPYNDVKFGQQVQEAVAPLQEQIKELTDTINEIRDNIAPISEEEATQLSSQFNPNEEAPIRNNLTPEESRELDYLESMNKKFPLKGTNLENLENLRAKEQNNPETEISSVRDLNDVRDYEEVGKKDVKAYQYEHPEVKPYFQLEAQRMLGDLENSIKAEKFAVKNNEKGVGSSQWDWVGIKRQTSPEIAELLDGDRGYSYSYDDIRKGLNAIIEDHGNENIAVAKRIEFYLDERLRNGYTTMEGYEIEPNQEYLNFLREQEWNNYYEQAPTIEAPKEAPKEAEDFSDVQINYEPFMDMINGLGENQSIREQQAQKVDTKQTNRINKPKGAKNFLKRAFVNEFATVDEFAQTHNAPQIKYKADTYNNYQPIAQSNIEHAQTDFNGKEIGRSWNSIWQVAEKKGLTEALNDYLIQWSNLDRQRRGKGTEVSYEQSKKLIEKYDAAYPELKPLAKDVWQYFRNYRHGMRDTGYISAETSNVLGHSDPHYIPFISDGIENYYTDSKEIKPRRTIKRAKGGAESGMLLPVQEAGTRYTYSVFNTVFGNDLYRDIIKASNDIVRIGADTRNNYVDNADNLFMDENGYYITAYENGEPITGRISEDMYKTLSRQMNSTIKDIEQKLSFVTKPLQKLSRLRRDILTKYSPTFPIKNVTKDVQDAEFNSKYTLDFNKEYANPNNWYELATNKGDAQQFRSLYGGGLEMGMFNVDSGLYNAKKGLKNFNFLKGIENVNELMELAPRYAEFKASLKNGATIQEAMYNAREVTTNFSRGGVIAKALNRNGFTFLNASIQGFDKFIRNFSGENGAKGVANSLLKAAMFGVAPAVFNELVFGWGDDKDEEYEALPSYIKDNYYLIKMSNGEFIRIPKGRMLSVFGSAARRTLEMAQGDEDAFKGYLSNVNNQIGINNPEENNIFAPMIQAFGSKNGNAWYGGDIVPTRLQDKPTGEQYDESTDKLSIWLGEKTGISPYKLNYVLDQYTGGIGDLILPYMTEESNTSAEGIGRALAPIKDQFVVDSTYDNKYVSNFYSKKEEITTKANGSKATDEDQLQKKYLDSISKQMTELYAEKREIQSNPDLSKTEKYEKATEIKKEINRLAKEGLENYQDISKDGDYASVGENDYQKTEDGWKKVSSKSSDDMNSMGLNNKEKSQYSKTQTELNNIKNKYKGSSSEADSINKRTEIINTITTSNLSDDAKVQLYKTYYSDNMVDDYVTMGMNVDSYLNYKKQNFTADKYANGKSISGSKKQKVFDYINSMDIPYEQKLILAKEQYNSWNDGNAEIIQYLNNNKNVDYQTMEDILKHLGFKVENGNISW